MHLQYEFINIQAFGNKNNNKYLHTVYYKNIFDSLNKKY